MADSGWYEVQDFGRGITMIREPFHSEDVKSYLVEGEERVAVLDTGIGVGGFPELVAAASGRPPVVLQTHAHWDHFGASHQFPQVFVHAAEAAWLAEGFPADRYARWMTAEFADVSRLPEDFDPSQGLPGCAATGFLHHGGQVDLGGRVLQVYHTPGHSPGGVSFLDRQGRALFVGDLLYLSKMLLHFPQSDPAAFRRSLQLAAELALQVDDVFPAHGPTPITPDDVRAIRDANEEIVAGRPPDGAEFLYGYPALMHDFGRFSIYLPPE
ncbi:MAG: MBL fold metallo-hydrolase [Thermomicrobiales bacterium]